MRIERLGGAEARRAPALLLDAVKATGFFPGPRAVLLEEATDGLAPAVAAALDAWAEGDARIVATGGSLAAKGALRKLFEGRRGVVAITLYDDPPTAGDLRDQLREAGLSAVEPAAFEDLLALSQALPVGELRGLVERLALHQAGEAGSLDAATVAALAPQDGEADLDALLAAVSDRQGARVPPLLRRIVAQGTGPVAVAIQALRHFRALLAVRCDPGGPASGLAALRPPVGGARRLALQRGAEAWPREQVEAALRELVSLDLALRSSAAVPQGALLERTLLRVAGMERGGQRG